MKPYAKEFWKELALALWMGLILPASLLGLAVGMDDRQQNSTTQTTPTSTLAPSEQAQQPLSSVIINVLNEGTVTEMDLETYLAGVVLGEMPADFEAEALKAQAVVARTFTLRSEQIGKHNAAAVCTDSNCCQAYISPESYLSQGGTQENIDRIYAAVTDTQGMVLTYNGELIEATYFSCSGGSTEDAVAVWGTDVPYLRATDSPGEEQAAHYTDTVSFSADEFMKALGLKLDGAPKTWLGSVTYTAGGGVDTMLIGNVSFSGTELRNLLALRSTAFTMTADDTTITITTRGYGHRVGMSQYGADAMAANGSSYDKILAHYYQGTKLVQWTH